MLWPPVNNNPMWSLTHTDSSPLPGFLWFPPVSNIWFCSFPIPVPVTNCEKCQTFLGMWVSGMSLCNQFLHSLREMCWLLSCVALREGLRGELCRWRTITSPPYLTNTRHAGSLHRAPSCCLTDINNSPHREQLRRLSCHMSHFILPDSDGTAESSRSQCSAHRHFVFHYSVFFHREYFVHQYTYIAII